VAVAIFHDDYFLGPTFFGTPTGHSDDLNIQCLIGLISLHCSVGFGGVAVPLLKHSIHFNGLAVKGSGGTPEIAPISISWTNVGYKLIKGL